MKSVEETMNVLEAYDLTRSLRAAGELAGLSPAEWWGWVTCFSMWFRWRA